MSEQWIAKNITSKSYSIGINGAPHFSNGTTFDLLTVVTPNEICQANRLKTLIRNGYLIVDRQRNGESYKIVNAYNVDDPTSLPCSLPAPPPATPESDPKIDKVLNAVVGNVAVWATGGEIADSGVAITSIGVSGFSGYSGYSGSGGSGGGGNGASGYSGFSGYSGYSGESGTSGYSGISGYSGLTGPAGISGYSGAGFSAGAQAGNTVYAGPTTGTATPSFRQLVANDIPTTLNATSFSGLVSLGAGLSHPTVTNNYNSDHQVEVSEIYAGDAGLGKWHSFVGTSANGADSLPNSTWRFVYNIRPDAYHDDQSTLGTYHWGFALESNYFNGTERTTEWYIEGAGTNGHVARPISAGMSTSTGHVFVELKSDSLPIYDNSDNQYVLFPSDGSQGHVTAPMSFGANASGSALDAFSATAGHHVTTGVLEIGDTATGSINKNYPNGIGIRMMDAGNAGMLMQYDQFAQQLNIGSVNNDGVHFDGTPALQLGVQPGGNLTIGGGATLHGYVNMAADQCIMWHHPTRPGDIYIQSQTTLDAGNPQTVTFGPGYRGRAGDVDEGVQYGWQIESGWIPSAIVADQNVEHYLLFIDRTGTQRRPISMLHRKADGTSAIYLDCTTNGICGLGNSDDPDVWLQYNGHGNYHDINGSFRTRGLRFNGWIADNDSTYKIVDFGVVGTSDPNLTFRYGDANTNGTMRIQANAPTGLRFETLNNTPIMFDPGTSNVILSKGQIPDTLDYNQFNIAPVYATFRYFNDELFRIWEDDTNGYFTFEATNPGTHLRLKTPAAHDILLAPGNNVVLTTNLVAAASTAYGQFGAATIGAWVPDGNFAAFTHNNFRTSGSYGFMHDSSGNTYVNAESGHTLYLRNANSDLMTLVGSQVTAAVPFVTSSTFDANAGATVTGSAFPLTITSTASVMGALLLCSSSGNSAYFGLRGGDSFFQHPPAGQVRIEDSTDGSLGTLEAGKLLISPGGTQRLQVDYGVSVGGAINLYSGSNWLRLQSDSRIDIDVNGGAGYVFMHATLAPNGIRMSRSGDATSASNVYSSSELQYEASCWNGTGAAFTYGGWRLAAVPNNNGVTRMTFSARDNTLTSGVENDYFWIQNDGKASLVGDLSVPSITLNGVQRTTWPSGGGTPGGSDGQIQYNSSGSFAGSSSIFTSGGDLILDAGSSAGGNLYVTGNTTAGHRDGYLGVGRTDRGIKIYTTDLNGYIYADTMFIGSPGQSSVNIMFNQQVAIAITNGIGSGASMLFSGYTSNPIWRPTYSLNSGWSDGTDATRKARITSEIYDAGGNRQWLQVDTDGSNPSVSVSNVLRVNTTTDDGSGAKLQVNGKVTGSLYRRTAYATTITETTFESGLDASTDDTFKVSLTASRNFTKPVNGIDGQTIRVVIVTNGYGVTFDPGVNFGSSVPSPTTGTDYYTLTYNGSTSKWDVIGFKGGF